jgi:hypothetical protein
MSTESYSVQGGIEWFTYDGQTRNVRFALNITGKIIPGTT